MRKLSHPNYTVGWICALPLEMAAAKAMLDDVHHDLPVHPSDHNTYTLGNIDSHNIVIACLPSGVYGTTSAATVAAQMMSTFPCVRFGLLVGIGGGVPRSDVDIRLGDIVVSIPTAGYGGVVQYDYGKAMKDGIFQRTGTLNKPPQVLLTAVSKVRASYMTDGSCISFFLSEMTRRYPSMSKFTIRHEDRLFMADNEHIESENGCDECNTNTTVVRSVRESTDPVVHYGLIASGNQVIKHARTRDRFAQEQGILCFECEAAGLMDNFPSLVIRGICDYADSHKNDQWQPYAAAGAAAFAKEILSVIPSNNISQLPTALTATSLTGAHHVADLTELETFSEIGHKEFSAQNWKSAIKYFSQALTGWQALSWDTEQVNKAQKCYAEALFKLRDFEASQGQSRSLLSRYVEKYGPSDPRTTGIRSMLAQALEQGGHYEEARNQWNICAKAYQRPNGEHTADSLQCLYRVGILASSREAYDTSWGYWEEARKCLELVVDNMSKKLTKWNDEQRLQAWIDYADALRKMCRDQEAMKQYQSAQSVATQLRLPKSHTCCTRIKYGVEECKYWLRWMKKSRNNTAGRLEAARKRNKLIQDRQRLLELNDHWSN